MHCFCLRQFLAFKNLDKIEFSDGQHYCSTWLKNFLTSNTLMFALALIITVINLFAKEILRCKFISS